MSDEKRNSKETERDTQSSSRDQPVADNCGCFAVVDACGCQVVDPCGCYVSQCCC